MSSIADNITEYGDAMWNEGFSLGLFVGLSFTLFVYMIR